MKCILLCAGYATRLFPLTENFPKALLEIEDGKPLLDYIISEVNTIDEVDEVFIITNNRYFDHFNNWAASKTDGKPIKVLNDHTMSNDDRLGAIGDINYTIEKENINEDLMIIAGDNLFDYSLRGVVDYFLDKSNPVVCAKIMEDKEQLKSMAVAKVSESKQIIDLVEKPKNPESDIAV